MKSIERPPFRTQFLIFTLFGDYILPRSGAIWTSSLVHLLGLLDVGERAVRMTLSRMSRKGWLIAQKYGRRSRYSLTPKGWELLKQGEQRIFEPPFSDWDGLWQILVYSLPEKKRRLRHTLRQRLNWLGFGLLSPNTWISPHNRGTELLTMCKELGMTGNVEIFSGIHGGTSLDKDLVQRCWDLSDLADQYQDFVNRYWGEFEGCKNTDNGRESLSPEASFIRRFWLMYDFQSFPSKDPNLPTILLPSNWAGFEARNLFDEYYKLLEFQANQFIDSIIDQEGS